jgi:hypothetical protein
MVRAFRIVHYALDYTASCTQGLKVTGNDHGPFTV